MPGGRCGLFPGIERLHQSEEYKQREAEDKLLREVGRDRLLELSKAEKEGRLVVLPIVEVYDARLEEAGYLLNVLQRELHTDGLNLKVAERVAELAREEAEMPEPPRLGMAQGTTAHRKKG